MTNFKATKRALGASILSVVLCISMLVGTTFAWFTDVASNTGNRIVAGNLDISLLMRDDNGAWNDIGPTDGDIFQEGATANNSKATLWEPGKTQVAYLAVQNNGNLALKYAIQLDIEDNGLAGALVYDLIELANENDVVAKENLDWTVFDQMAGGRYTIAEDTMVEASKGNKDETHYYALVVHMMEDADNKYNVATNDCDVEIDVTVLATQLDAESDNFGTDYDEGLDPVTSYVSTEAGLAEALSNGRNVELMGDVALTEACTIPAGAVTTLNLNGYEISAAIAKADGAMIVNAGKLTVTNGEISNSAVNGGAVIENKGELVLDDVTIQGAPIDATGYPAYAVATSGKLTVEDGTTISANRGAISMSDGAEVIINGGELVVSDAADGRNMTLHTIYAYGYNSTLTIKDGYFEMNHTSTGGASVICPAGAKINIYGGDFRDAMDDSTWTSTGNFQNYMGYGVALNVQGGTYDDKTVEKNLATGYKVVEVTNGTETLYYVVPENTTTAATPSEVQAALSAGGDIMLTADVTYGSSITKDAVVDLAGNTFEATSTLNLGNNADLTMSGGNYTVNGTYGHVDVRPSTAEGSVVTFEDVDFSYNKKNNTYGPSTNRLGSVVEVCAIATDAKTVIVFKDCTFDNAQILIEGLSGTTGEVDATFENCTFNALTSSAPIYVQNYVKGKITVKNCTFNLECTSSSASAISVSPSTSTTVTVIAENNTINAVAATPYTHDAAKGETSVDDIKVNGTPANIKLISAYGNTTVTETNTVKTGIAQ